MSDLYYRYFLFSQEQKNMRLKVEGNLGKQIKFGTVVVNGVAKQYTDIVIDPNKSKFSDAVIVTHGDIRKIKYTEPS